MMSVDRKKINANRHDIIEQVTDKHGTQTKIIFLLHYQIIKWGSSPETLIAHQLNSAHLEKFSAFTFRFRFNRIVARRLKIAHCA